MVFKRFLLLMAVSAIFASCVLIQEIKSKKSAPDESDQTVQIGKTDMRSDDLMMSLPRVNGVPEKNAIWYHPNPWWRIETKPFPVHKDSLGYRILRPQHGWPVYEQYITRERDRDTWKKWQSQNKFFDIPDLVEQYWGHIIRSRSEIFQKHPEYLAEIDGVRQGFAKSAKLCVSNPTVRQIYADFWFEQLAKNPQRPYVSVDPSDGARFCACPKCAALGGENAAVFFFANDIAKKIRPKYPETKANLLAYYLFIDTPQVKLEPNLLVGVTPGAFQHLYRPEALMSVWAQKHPHLYLRDYFGIPEWTADHPRIFVETHLTRAELMRKNGYEGMIMENGLNINAAILAVLMGARWMNPQLSWDQIFNKFIGDCFPETQQPMRRLFLRWHHTWFREEEIRASLHDLGEAYQLVKNPLERERILDLMAYVHIFGIFFDWFDDKNNPERIKTFFEYMQEAGSRNLVHSTALDAIYGRQLPDGNPYKNNLKQHTLKTTTPFQLTREKILANYQADVKRYGLRKIDFTPLYEDALSKLPFLGSDYSTEFTLRFRGDHSLRMVASGKLSTKLVSSGKNPSMVSISNADYSFLVSKILTDGETWEINLPKHDTYHLSYHRNPLATLEFRGRFIPVLNQNNEATNQMPLFIRSINGWERATPKQPVFESHAWYFVLNR